LFSYVTAARGRLTSARAMTLTSAAYNFGAIIGPITGGWIASQYGLRSIYFVVASIFVISLIILLFLKPQSKDNHDPDQPPVKLVTNKRYLTILALSFSATFVMYLAQPLTPKFLEVERGMSLSQVGIIGSIGSIGSVVMNLVLGQMNSRVGFILAQGLVGLFTLMLWKGNGIFWFGFGYFLLGGYRAARVLIFAQVRSFIHQAQMGLAYGLTETLNSFAIMLSPLLAGWLYTQNPESVFMVALGLIFFSILAGILLTPQVPSNPGAEKVVGEVG